MKKEIRRGVLGGAGPSDFTHELGADAAFVPSVAAAAFAFDLLLGLASTAYNFAVEGMYLTIVGMLSLGLVSPEGHVSTYGLNPSILGKSQLIVVVD